MAAVIESSSRTRATGPSPAPGGSPSAIADELEIGVEHAARLHLVPVVILGVDPEHRDGGHAMFGGRALGESNAP